MQRGFDDRIARKRLQEGEAIADFLQRVNRDFASESQGNERRREDSDGVNRLLRSQHALRIHRRALFVDIERGVASRVRDGAETALARNRLVAVRDGGDLAECSARGLELVRFREKRATVLSVGEAEAVAAFGVLRELLFRLVDVLVGVSDGLERREKFSVRFAFSNFIWRR